MCLPQTFNQKSVIPCIPLFYIAFIYWWEIRILCLAPRYNADASFSATQQLKSTSQLPSIYLAMACKAGISGETAPICSQPSFRPSALIPKRTKAPILRNFRWDPLPWISGVNVTFPQYRLLYRHYQGTTVQLKYIGIWPLSTARGEACWQETRISSGKPCFCSLYYTYFSQHNYIIKA